MARFWKGEFYGRSSGILADLRLLILGESNYSSDPIGTADEDIVLRTMGRVLAGEKFSFFNKLSRLVMNGGETWLTQDQSVQFWHSVAFHNFVPLIAANTYRQRPPKAFWVGEAPRLFSEVVRELRPEAILVCGFELWGHLPEGLPTTKTYRAKGEEWPVKEYDIGAGYPAVAVPIPHPSGFGWTYGECVSRLDRLFDNVASVRAADGREAPSRLPLGRL